MTTAQPWEEIPPVLEKIKLQPTNLLPVGADVAELQRRFDHLNTVVGSWIRHIPTLEKAQEVRRELLDIEMDCDDHDLSQRINWLFKAIDRVLEVLKSPAFDPYDVEWARGKLGIPPNDLNFKHGLDARGPTLVYFYAIWDGRKDFIGRAKKIAAELRRRDKANTKKKADE